MNGTSIQVPLQAAPEQWTVVNLNVHWLLDSNKVFSPSQPQKFYLRSFTLQASLFIKGVFTSDIEYNPNTLPKAFLKPPAKGKNWFEDYAWLSVPERDMAEYNNTALQ